MNRQWLFFFLFAFSFVVGSSAQDAKRPFKGSFYNKENDIKLELDLYDTTIVAPSYSFLGAMNGYMTGNLYDIWFVTDHSVKKNKATVKLTNDLGADTQELILYFNKEGKLMYETSGTNFIRRSENRKWVKIPEKMVFERKK